MTHSPTLRPLVDLRHTRRQFLFAREQAAQGSTERYRRVLEMRRWSAAKRGRPGRTPLRPSL